MACSVFLKDGIKVMFKRTNMKTHTYKWFFKTHFTCDQIKLLGTSFNITAKPINSYRKTFINSYSSDTKQDVTLHVEYFSENSSKEEKGVDRLKPVFIAHGMLGSASNWSSMAKSIARKTGRKVIIFDARNHGKSGHTKTMSYHDMSSDLIGLIKKEQENYNYGTEHSKSVILIGHSMGGRTCMYTALRSPDLVHSMIVVDISPVNQKFNLEDGSEWNMDHFFHAMKAVNFLQPSEVEKWSLSKSRSDADKQLAHRIKDANIRAWLLMNMGQLEDGSIGWTNNLNAIHDSFRKDISQFPSDCYSNGTTFNKETLFIGGAESEYIPVTDHSEILEIFPSSVFEYIDGAGHWVHSQKPKEFLDVVIEYLRNMK